MAKIKLDSIDLAAAIAEAEQQLAHDQSASAGTRAAFQLLLLVVKLLVAGTGP